MKKKTEKKLKVEYIPINKLKEFAKNPRKEKKGGLIKLEDSHKKFGWTNPILVQRSTGTIIAGHQRLKMAKKRGVKVVPVIYLDMTNKEAAQYNIADNKLPEEIAKWDKKILAELSIDIGGDYNKDIKVTGFDEKEYSDLMEKFGNKYIIDLTKNPGESVSINEKIYLPFWLVIRGDIEVYKKVQSEINKILKKIKSELVINSSEDVFK